MAYTCENCGKTFVKHGYYIKHLENRVCHTRERFACQECDTSFTRRHNLRHHMRVVHAGGQDANRVFLCGLCEKRFPTMMELNSHRKSHGRIDDAPSLYGFQVINTAHKKKCQVLRLIFPDDVQFVTEAILYLVRRLQMLLKLKLMLHKMIKVAFTLYIEFVKLNHDAEIETMIVAPFRSMMTTVYPLADIESIVMNSLSHILNTVQEFVQGGSGWAINDILFFDMELVECRPLSGGCGEHQVKFIRDRGVIFTQQGFDSAQQDLTGSEEMKLLDMINGERRKKNISALNLEIKPTENCFYLAVAKHFVSRQEELETFIRDHMNTCLPTPVKLQSISLFEEANSALDLSVNVVYKDDTRCIYPVYVSKRIHAKNVITLMLRLTNTVLDEDSDPMVFLHYAYIENPHKLLAIRDRSELTGKTRTRQGILCFNCFNFQSTKASYENHVKWCHEKTGQQRIYPDKGQTMFFEGGSEPELKASLCLYFDFECYQKHEGVNPCSCAPAVQANTKRVENMSEREFEQFVLDQEHEEQLLRLEGKKRRNNAPKLCPHKSRVLSEHHAFSYAYVLINREGKLVEQKSYVGEDAAEHFIKTVINIERTYLADLIYNPCEMSITDEDYDVIRATTDCIICGEMLGSDRVRHHDHQTGNFIGLAHNTCNLQTKEKRRLYCFCHNFSGYDGKIIAKNLGKCQDDIWKVEAIPLNTQKFKMLRINNIIFLDSFAFLSASLEKLVETLVVSNHNFPIMKQQRWSDIVSHLNNADNVMQQEEEEGDEDSEAVCRELLLRKGVFPYDSVTSLEFLRETTSLPPKSAFFRVMGEEDITDLDYAHASNVWHTFKCKSLEEYALLYNLTDAFLIAEAMEEMRGSIHDQFGLDLAYYLSLPMLSRELMLKVSQAEIELISDVEISNAFQSSIRGGVSFISQRYVDLEAFNKLRHDAGLEPASIAFVDANNL